MIKQPKILVVNPNTSPEVTAWFTAEAQRCNGGRAMIDAVTGTFGAAIVSTLAEEVIAAHSALSLLAEHARGYDAVILAISFDSGLAAARSVMPIPVIGITEAAVFAALELGGPVGLVTFGEVSLPLYRRLVREYNIEPHLAGIEVIDIASSADYLDVTKRDEAVCEAAGRLASLGAVAVVICGAAVVGIARRLQPEVSIALFDGAAPSVAAAIARIHSSPSVVTLPRPLSSSTGLSPSLKELIAGNWPSPETELPDPSLTNTKE